MTDLVDITDPTIAKAYAHPLRIEILGLLENRVATPMELATEMGAGLSQTSYHVRQLKNLGLIRLVKRRMKRGAVEHYYTAAVRPTITDVGWARVPKIVKRAVIGGKVAQAGKDVAAAAERGGFDRDDIHFSRTRLRVAPAGWTKVTRELATALERIDAIAADEAAELEEDPQVPSHEATVIMIFFESAPPESFESSGGASVSGHDELEDLAPHE